MTTRRLHDPDASSSVFLVERYLPPAAAGNLAGAVGRLAQLCARSAESGAGCEVQYLLSAYLPTEDTCFCLFRAAAADIVRALNDKADFALDRITAAVRLYPASQLPDVQADRSSEESRPT
jgi:hypothetical protein